MKYIRYTAPDIEIKKGSNKKIIILDGAEIPDLKTLYDTLVNELEFPEYFGDNLDALYDMLTDLQWLSQNCFELLLYNYEEFLRDEDIETKAEVISIMDETVECWKEEVPEDVDWDTKIFHVLLVGDAQQLKHEVAQLGQYLETEEEE